MRYFLIDRIDELKPGEWADATRCISLSDDCFEHHFPGQPVYPGALLVECMAQLGGALLEISLKGTREYTPRCVLSSVKAKFREFVRPGDVLRVRAEIRSLHDESALVRCSMVRDGKRVTQADLVYVFLEVPDPRLEASRNDFLEIITRTTRFVE